MPVDYQIFPALNLLVYICTDSITPTEFFNTGDRVRVDPRFADRMNVILDFFAAELEASVTDLHLAIHKYRETSQSGKAPGSTAILTRSTALKYLGEALITFSMDSITNFGIFHNEHDVLRWLDLPRQETLQHWQSLRNQIDLNA